MDEEQFRELFHRFIEQYELSPDIAEELLQKILNILKYAENNQTHIEKLSETR